MRNIFIVTATQVVTSDSHPEGIYSAIQGYPKTFDSRSYNATEENPDGDSTKALQAAKSDYYARLSANYSGSANRVMATVSLETADGRQIMKDSIGTFPEIVRPEHEPEPEPEEELVNP